MSARISIDGNLATDPEYGVSDGGKSWARLRVASNERVRGGDGGWTASEPQFFTVAVFDTAAEHAANTFHRGDPVHVDGRFELEQFDRRDGTRGAALKVYARTVQPRDIGDTAAASRDAGHQAAPSAPPPLPGPTVHHTPTGTVITGVSRDDTATQHAVKDVGFKWSPQASRWYLPVTLDEQTRALRVADLTATLAAAGTDLHLTDQPPQTRGGGATKSSPTPEPAEPAMAPAPVRTL